MWRSRRSVACTIATKGGLRNRRQVGPADLLPGKLQPTSRKAGTCRRKGSTTPMTSRTPDRGAERRAETAVFGRQFLQRMHQYRILAKDGQVPALRTGSPRVVTARTSAHPLLPRGTMARRSALAPEEASGAHCGVSFSARFCAGEWLTRRSSSEIRRWTSWSWGCNSPAVRR